MEFQTFAFEHSHWGSFNFDLKKRAPFKALFWNSLSPCRPHVADRVVVLCFAAPETQVRVLRRRLLPRPIAVIERRSASWCRGLAHRMRSQRRRAQPALAISLNLCRACCARARTCATTRRLCSALQPRSHNVPTCLSCHVARARRSSPSLSSLRPSLGREAMAI